MPGLSLVYRRGLNRSSALNSLADLKHEPYYALEKIIDSDNMLSVFSGYEGYPRRTLEYDDSVIFVEGLIYNRSEADIESSLLAISKAYTENSDYKTLITKFIHTSDGDFNILILSKPPQKFIVFNDRWGRLPSYLYYDDDMFVFSREPKFILHFIPSIEFDRVSVAEWLLFEFTLGERTLIKGISKVSPSQVLYAEPFAGGIKVEGDQVFGLNFEDASETLSRDECIEECERLFQQSVNDRVSKIQEKRYNITADLSGGFDTRAVFGGLCKTGAEIDYYTEQLLDNESEYAVKLADLYGKEVTRVSASHEMDIPDMRRLIYMTDCAVNGLTALLCYQSELERFRQVKRMSVQFAGLGGGEFTKRIPRAQKGYKSMVDMMKAGHLVGPGNMERICRLARLNEETFSNHLTGYFDGYPESTLNGKVRHWHFEYENKLVSLGEDRSRLHIWPVEPLWSKDLFSFIMMHIPEKYIVGEYDFYLDFLRAIDPGLLKSPFFSYNTVTNSRLSSCKYYLLTELRALLFRMGRSNRVLRHWLLKLYRRRRTLIEDSNQREKIERGILEGYSQLNMLSAFSDKKRVQDFIDSADRSQLYRLLALMLYFREIENRHGHKVCIKA